jgi:1-acyl-sn-glycerol-3-phosphate acyltransferase
MPKPGNESSPPFDRNDPLVRLFLGYARVLARYHQHRVLHLERIDALLRKGRRVVLVGNHALDVLDPLLFTAALIDRYGRLPHFIGHENLIFRMPGLGEIARRYQMIPSRRMRETAAALRTSGLLMLYPGSGSEAARQPRRALSPQMGEATGLLAARLALRCRDPIRCRGGH